MPSFCDDAGLEPEVISEAVGPIIGGQRKPPILRIRRIGVAFMVENKRLGHWKVLASTRDRDEAFRIMHEGNQRALAQFQSAFNKAHAA
jgi:hypothetical protein